MSKNASSDFDEDRKPGNPQETDYSYEYSGSSTTTRGTPPHEWRGDDIV